MTFVHLHTHSEYSCLDSTMRIQEAFGRAKELGQASLAITDHGNLAAALHAQTIADTHEMQYIPGCEFYLAFGSRNERNLSDDNSNKDDEDLAKPKKYMHLTVLATSEHGWKSLVKLNNLAQDSVWSKPRIDIAALAEHAQDIIVLTGCLGGPVLGPASRARLDIARKNLLELCAAVGQENVYVELMEHGIQEESDALQSVVDLARELNVAIVATNDAHYTYESDVISHAAWLLVQSKSTFQKPKYQFSGSGYWLKSEQEMRALRSEPWWQEACDNTTKIALRCVQRSIPSPKNHMPIFPTPEGFATNEEYLFSLLREGAKTLYGGVDRALQERVLTEVSVIEKAGMIDYFLVVHDLVSWAKNQGILVGPGRGSAGGSEIAYLLGITMVQPRAHGLLFERFYEEGRIEPPDIDIDFPQGRRQEVIEYLRVRWGADSVALIGTFTIERTKKAILDAGRVLGKTPKAIAMNKLVPVVDAKPTPIKKLLDASHIAHSEYIKLHEKDTDVQKIHEIASKLENIVANPSIHASGVIVANTPLDELVPLRKTEKGSCLQWSGPEAEQFGLLKIDVLGLRNLDVVEKAVQYIKATTGETVDPLGFPVTGKRADAAWSLISSGKTAGIFQMESKKMAELAMQVEPKNLDELSVVIALYRPGPMSAGMHTTYAKRKRGEEQTDYRAFTTDVAEQHELKKVLGQTHAVWVYQEQLMQLGSVVAGFDAKMRSKLRKAVSKKNPTLMDEVGCAFLEGATRAQRDANGAIVSIAFSKQTAEVLWEAMLGSAAYLFNRSHSTTYAYLAFITAFLKANWAAQYAAAALAVSASDDKRIQILSDLRSEGIEILPPDLNLSQANTVSEKGRVRLGLCEIKGLGSVAHLVVSERVANGKFASLRDVYTRTRKSDDGSCALTHTHLKALVDSGAADAFGSRYGHTMIIGAIPAGFIPVPDIEWGVLEKSSRQRQSLLLPIGVHPLVALREQLALVRISAPAGGGFETRPLPVTQLPDTEQFVTTLGVLASWSEKSYSKGRFASITLEGSSGSVSGTIWDNVLSQMKKRPLPKVGSIVLARGKIKYTSIVSSVDDTEKIIKELYVSELTTVEVADPCSEVIDERSASLQLMVENVALETPTPGFTLTKTSDPQSGTHIEPGDLITYTVTGVNTGNTVLDPVVMTDDLGTVLTYASLVDTPKVSLSDGSASPDPVVFDGDVLTWEGVLLPGQSVSLIYTVKIHEDLFDITQNEGVCVVNLVNGSATPPGGEEIVPPPPETEHCVPPFIALSGKALGAPENLHNISIRRDKRLKRNLFV